MATTSKSIHSWNLHNYRDTTCVRASEALCTRRRDGASDDEVQERAELSRIVLWLQEARECPQLCPRALKEQASHGIGEASKGAVEGVDRSPMLTRGSSRRSARPYPGSRSSGVAPTTSRDLLAKVAGSQAALELRSWYLPSSTSLSAHEVEAQFQRVVEALATKLPEAA